MDSRVTGGVYPMGMNCRCRRGGVWVRLLNSLLRLFGLAQRLAIVGFPQLYVTTSSSRQISSDDGRYPSDGATRVEATLSGRYCHVTNRAREDRGHAPVRYLGPPTFHWNKALKIRADSETFRDLMAYYHVTCARRHFDALLHELFVSIQALDKAAWLVELPVIVDEAEGWIADNAAWERSVKLRRLRFGANGPFVLDSVVIYHEYAHAIIDVVTGEPYFPSAYRPEYTNTEKLATAVCEAYADYLACSLRDHAIVLEGAPRARRLDHPVRFEPAASRNAYRDSLALSTGLWELREHKRLGRKVVDALVVQSLVELRASSHRLSSISPSDAARLAMKVDDLLYGSVHLDVIEGVFWNRGLL